MTHAHVPKEDIKLVGWIVVRILGLRDRFIVNEVVAWEEDLYVLYGEESDPPGRYGPYFSWSDPKAKSWFVVDDFESQKRPATRAYFEFYDPTDESYVSRVIQRYDLAIKEAERIAFGTPLSRDRKELFSPRQVT